MFSVCMLNIEDMVREVCKILEKIIPNLKTSYERSVISLICRFLDSSYRCYTCNRSIPVCAYSLLKLCIELIIQLRYFMERYGVDKLEHFLKDLSKRGRRGSSFSIR